MCWSCLGWPLGANSGVAAISVLVGCMQLQPGHELLEPSAWQHSESCSMMGTSLLPLPVGSYTGPLHSFKVLNDRLLCVQSIAKF